MINKNRNRSGYSFANINLLGKCNAQCFFCLGGDIPELLNLHNQTKTHFSEWVNFPEFISQCEDRGIEKIYITGQNTDSLIYRHLGELVDYLQTEHRFQVGLRTNGYLLKRKHEEVIKCQGTVGISIHSLTPDTNFKIMKHRDIPDWDTIIPRLPNVRVSIVINRYNVGEFLDLVRYISGFDNVKYIQVRRISTDTRYEEFEEDIRLYEELHAHIAETYPKTGEFYLAQQYEMFGKEVDFWRTVETSVNSMNYFTDGTISGEYFVVEGYLQNYKGGSC